jgi:hypothetical protein
MRIMVIAAVALSFAVAGTVAGSAHAQKASSGATAPKAPIGHRQPKAKDLPPDSTNQVSAEDRALDKALKGICRGC